MVEEGRWVVFGIQYSVDSLFGFVSLDWAASAYDYSLLTAPFTLSSRQTAAARPRVHQFPTQSARGMRRRQRE